MNKYFLLLLVWICLFQYSCQQKQKTEDSKTAGNQVVSIDSISLSIDRLNLLIQKEPRNAKFLHSRARIYIGMKKFDEAFKDVQAAIAIDSAQSTFYMSLADIYFAGKKSLASKNALEKAIKLDPHNKDANLKLAELYLFVKKHALSIQYIDAVLQEDKYNPKAYFMKGMNFKEAGDTVKAISSFQTASEQDPRYYDAFMQLGVLFGLKNNPLSVQYFTTAISLQPNNEEAYYGRAMFLQEHGQAERAIEDYKRIQSINPRNKYAHYNQGYIYLVIFEKYDAAVGYFSNAIMIDPEYTEAYFNRGLAYELSGNEASAKNDYLKALKISQSYEPARARLKGLK